MLIVELKGVGSLSGSDIHGRDLQLGTLDTE